MVAMVWGCVRVRVRVMVRVRVGVRIRVRVRRRPDSSPLNSFLLLLNT